MDYLRAYSFHGCYPIRQSSSNALGDCRLCGSYEHFSIAINSGLFRCFKCEASGNLYTYLRLLWEKLSRDFWIDSRLGWTRLKALASERGINSHLLRDYGFVYDPFLSHWVLPIYAPAWNQDRVTVNSSSPRKLVNLKRWVNYDGKRQFHGTPCCSTHLFNLDRILRQNPGLLVTERHGDATVRDPSEHLQIHVCEGEWDTLALVGVLGPSALVVGSPGANSFRRDWVDYVRLAPPDLLWNFLYDHDDAGLSGYESVASRLADASVRRTRSIGPGGTGPGRDLLSQARFLIWDKDRSYGFDVRDLCNELNHDRIAVLSYLNSRLRRRNFHEGEE